MAQLHVRREEFSEFCLSNCSASLGFVSDGSTKPISQVQVGDQVKSRDPETGQDEIKTVTSTVERHAPAVVNVALQSAATGQSETLTCTPEHPLFVSGQGWVEAGSLGIGTSIVTRAGPCLSVASVTWQRAQTLDSKPYTVYNLTVEDDHTFFVGSIDGGTWVHNLDCDLFSKAGGKPSVKAGFTRAGHAFDKHAQGQRGSSSLFPRRSGNPAARNATGQDLIDDILTDPGSVVTNNFRPRFGPTTEITAPDGRGLVYDSNGDFIFFKE